MVHVRGSQVSAELDEIVGQQHKVTAGFGVEPAESEQLLHETRGALGGAAQLVDHAARGGQVGRLAGARQAERQPGQRRADLMRRRGGELPLTQQHRKRLAVPPLTMC